MRFRLKLWSYVLSGLFVASVLANILFIKRDLQNRVYNFGYSNGFAQGQTQEQNKILSQIISGYESGRVEISDGKGNKIVLVPEDLEKKIRGQK